MSLPRSIETYVRIHPSSLIQSDSRLSKSICSFANAGYRYRSPDHASKWDEKSNAKRLPNAESVQIELESDGFFAILYDAEESIIACAGCCRWRGDLEGVGLREEKGWEIKIVTTRKDCMGMGMARRCIEGVLSELSVREHGRIRVWVQAVESLNGTFWRNQGWEEIRGYEKEKGHWGSKEGYTLLVLVREIDGVKS